MKINGKEFEAEIADTGVKHMRGLSGREKGNMLFIFPFSFRPRFWMWRMKFPIWISFLDENGMVFEVKYAEQMRLDPRTWKYYFPSKRCRHVLETQFEVKEGDRVEW